MTDKICLAISGTHGSGTSSAAKGIAEKLGLRFVSAGDIFRESAEKRGYKDVSNFTEIVEGDPELKDELDIKMKEEAERGNVVVEGRIACWTSRNFAHLRIMIDAPLHIRIARIAARSGCTYEEAEEETSTRESEEREWFLRNRGVDIYDTSIFDITINTERLPVPQVLSIIESAVQSIS
ncbi:MAG: (d)CMP kinase [Candidatus Hodarchaeales archaeon]